MAVAWGALPLLRFSTEFSNLCPKGAWSLAMPQGSSDEDDIFTSLMSHGRNKEEDEKSCQKVSGFPGGSVVKNPLPVQETNLIPGSGRSPEQGNGNPLQCSCLGNPMDRVAWQGTVHRVTKSHDWVTTDQQQQKL